MVIIYAMQEMLWCYIIVETKAQALNNSKWFKRLNDYVGNYNKNSDNKLKKKKY